MLLVIIVAKRKEKDEAYMSAKDEAMTVRMPKSRSAQGACSRLEPQPKLPPLTTRISALRYAGWLRTNSGFSSPVLESYRRAEKREIPRPVRLTEGKEARQQGFSYKGRGGTNSS